MKVINCKQGSAAWFQARCGRIGASEVADAVSMLKKGGETAARANLRAKVIAEELTGQPWMEGYLSPEMEWGTANENFARAAYELKTGLDVDQVGFVIHPAIERAGASPDGLIGNVGGLEIKCPKTSTHLRWLLAGEVPEEHRPQMYWGMACCERDWWDFVSYDPRLPDPLRLFVKRLEWNDEAIDALTSGVLVFLAEVTDTIAKLREMYGEFTIPAQIAAREDIGDLGLGAPEFEIYDRLTERAP